MSNFKTGICYKTNNLYCKRHPHLIQKGVARVVTNNQLQNMFYKIVQLQLFDVKFYCLEKYISFAVRRERLLWTRNLSLGFSIHP